VALDFGRGRKKKGSAGKELGVGKRGMERAVGGKKGMEKENGKLCLYHFSDVFAVYNVSDTYIAQFGPLTQSAVFIC